VATYEMLTVAKYWRFCWPSVNARGGQMECFPTHT